MFREILFCSRIKSLHGGFLLLPPSDSFRAEGVFVFAFDFDFFLLLIWQGEGGWRRCFLRLYATTVRSLGRLIDCVRCYAIMLDETKLDEKDGIKGVFVFYRGTKNTMNDEEYSILNTHTELNRNFDVPGTWYLRRLRDLLVVYYGGEIFRGHQALLNSPRRGVSTVRQMPELNSHGSLLV